MRNIVSYSHQSQSFYREITVIIEWLNIQLGKRCLDVSQKKGSLNYLELGLASPLSKILFKTSSTFHPLPRRACLNIGGLRGEETSAAMLVYAISVAAISRPSSVRVLPLP